MSHTYVAVTNRKQTLFRVGENRVKRFLSPSCMQLLRASSPDVPTQDDPAYKQLVRPHAILQVSTQDLQANKSQENSRRAEETGDHIIAEGSVFQESRTTYLEKKLDLQQQDMQVFYWLCVYIHV